MLELTQTHQLWLYLGLVIGIVVLPGMDMAFVMASSLSNGPRAGAAAVAGIVAGGAIHMAMGSMGVGWVLLTVPSLFNAFLLGGAAYIAWMGWSLLRGAAALGEVHRAQAQSLRATFMRAVLTCLLNPKAYVFTLAVLPQFVRAEYGSLLLQAIVLAAITSLVQTFVYGAVAAGASGLGGWLRGNAHAQIVCGRVVGSALMLTAAWTAWQGWHGDVAA